MTDTQGDFEALVACAVRGDIEALRTWPRDAVADWRSRTGLYNAAETSNQDAVLLASTRQVGDTVLHTSIRQGAPLASIAVLVEHFALDVNQALAHGRTPALLLACAQGRLDIVQYLCEHAGADPQLAAKYGESAMWTACYTGRLCVLRYLLDVAGVPLYERRNHTMLSPLEAAILRGHAHVAECLLVRQAGGEPVPQLTVNVGCQMWEKNLRALATSLPLTRFTRVVWEDGIYPSVLSTFAACLARCTNLAHVVFSSRRGTKAAPDEVAALEAALPDSHLVELRFMGNEAPLLERHPSIAWRRAVADAGGVWSEDCHRGYPAPLRHIILTLLVLARSQRPSTQAVHVALRAMSSRSLHALFRMLGLLNYWAN